MLRNRFFWVPILSIVMLGGAICSQGPDPEMLLRSCTIEFLNGRDPAEGHSFNIGTSINPPAKSSYRSVATISLDWDRLKSLNSDKLDMYFAWDPNTSSMRMFWHYVDPANNKDETRPMTWADFHSMRWHMSLSPYWVLCHVLQEFRADDNLPRYTFGADPENPAYYQYMRTAETRLTNGDEALFGLFIERLVIDPSNLTIVSYTVTSEDGDGVFFQDMQNLYDYQRDENTGDIVQVIVTQGSSVAKGKAYTYQVTPVVQ